MRRCVTVFLLIVAISFALALTACLGKSTPNPGGQGVSSVTLSPSANFSMDVGATQVFSATARNAGGGIIVGATQFLVSAYPQVEAIPPRFRSPAMATHAPEHGTPPSRFARPANPESLSSRP